MDGYQCYRRDRGSRGGGIVVYVKSDIVSNYRMDLIPISPYFNEILNHSGSFFLVTFYRPPNADQLFIDNFTHVLNNVKGINLDSKLCLLCDLIMPGIHWQALTGNNQLSSNICNLFQEHHLNQLNNEASRPHNDNILDIVLTNTSELFSEILTTDSVFHSDHYMLEFNISFQPKFKKKENRWVYNFKDADFNELNFRVEGLDLVTHMQSHGPNVDQAWFIWSLKIQELINNHKPKFAIKQRSSPWIDGECLHLIHLKKEAWKKARRSNSDQDWNSYKSINNQC